MTTRHVMNLIYDPAATFKKNMTKLTFFLTNPLGLTKTLESEYDTGTE
jgi:hypothetical protein